MRRLANLFLLLFTGSALLGLAAALAGSGAPALSLADAYRLSLLGCLACAALLYVGFAFNRHLPKAVLVPPGLWLLWSLLDLWPLDLLLPHAVPAITAAGQLLIGACVLLGNRLRNAQSPWLITDQFAGPAFSGRRLTFFVLLNLPLFPILVGILLFALLGTTIEKATAGFVDLKPNGLYMRESLYRRDAKSIRLAAMIHFARDAYYRDLQASLPEQGTLILAEGVSDREGLLDTRFSYRRVADLFGLTAQEDMRFPGRLIALSAIEQPADGIRPGIDILPADIDLRRFDPRTLDLLNALAEKFLARDSASAGWSAFNRWARERLTPELNAVVMRDLLDKRNRHLLSLLTPALRHYDHLVIPWGALHMPQLENALLERGFRPVSRRERLSIDFLRLPYGRIWHRLTQAAETD